MRIAHASGGGGPEFAGALTLPSGAGPHPAVLLVSPAGDHPRDELRRGGSHYSDLARQLAAHGIAALRVDNRGVGGSRHETWPKWDWGVSIEELTRDVAGHVAWLRRRPEIDMHRVGVLAHGDGVVPAARFAAEKVPGAKRPAFVVLLAATSARATTDLARRQVARVPEPKREQLEGPLRAALEKIGDEGASPGAIAATRGCMETLGVPEPEARAQAFVKTHAQRWYRDYFRYQPRATLRAIRGPILVLMAKDDERVAATASAKAIESTFRTALAFNSKVTLLDTGGHFLEPRDGRKVLREDVVAAVRRFIADATGFLRARDLPRGVSPAEELVIEDVAVVDVVAGKLREQRTVVVRDGRIARVAPADEVRPAEGATVIAGAGRFLVPGLWDCHGHVSMWGPDAFARLVARGVTAVRDMGGDLRELQDFRRGIGTRAILGPRLLLAGPFLDGDKPNDIYRRFVRKPSDVRATVTELAAAGVDFLKVHSMMPPDVLAELARVAAERKIAFAGHVPAGLTPLQASDAGMLSIEHADSFFSAMARAKDTPAPGWSEARKWWRGEAGKAAMRRIAENRTVVVPTLAIGTGVAERLGGTFAVIASWNREMTRSLRGAGVPLAAGTDFARRVIGIEPGVSLQHELELLVQAGLSAAGALRAATVVPARRFGGHPRGGSITPGEVADLVLLGGNPLADIGNVRKVEGVVLRGAWLSRGRLRELVTWAEAARRR